MPIVWTGNGDSSEICFINGLEGTVSERGDNFFWDVQDSQSVLASGRCKSLKTAKANVERLILNRLDKWSDAQMSNEAYEEFLESIVHH